MTQPASSPDLVPCNFWFFPKLKSPLKGMRFQTISEIQENTMGQLMAIGRMIWGPKMPTLNGTEVSWSYVQCFLYLVFSSINVSIFHITWLDTFWTDFVNQSYLTILETRTKKELATEKYIFFLKNLMTKIMLVIVINVYMCLIFTIQLM